MPERKLIYADTVVEMISELIELDEHEKKVVQKFVDECMAVDVVMIPCQIGDRVYRVDKGNYYSNWKPFVQELTVTEISWKKERYGEKDLGFAIIANGIRYKFTSIGKSVFLTRKEAEAKMDGERRKT